MTTDPGVVIRPLEGDDAPACDGVIRSLPYHIGDPDGRRECAEAVRASDGLVAVRDDQVVGFLTVAHHFEAVSEITWMSVGFLPARELPDLWPGDKALLLAMPLEGPPRLLPS
jgi:hypothetical protein